jgi:acyl dehydratase
VATSDQAAPRDRSRLYFEDFAVGRVFDLGERALSEDDIVSFAREWDPQPFHLDPEAAEHGEFGGLIASGWQTTCVWMRLYVDEVLNRAAMLTAPGVESVRWLRPVRPGMRLRGRTTILESWPSEQTPGRGTIRLQGELLDDDGEVVMTLVGRGHARLRGKEDGDGGR